MQRAENKKGFMKYLYQIPRNSKIYTKLSDGSSFLTFNRLDGMYSYCTTEKGGVFQLGVMTELEPYKGGYKLKKRRDVIPK